jgi:hypothetical protein
LSDPERDFAASRPLNIREVDENPLCGFGSQVDFVGGVLGDSLKRLEHKIELLNVGELEFAALRAGDFVLDDIPHDSGVLPPCRDSPVEVLDEVVGTVTGSAAFAGNQRVTESR